MFRRALFSFLLLSGSAAAFQPTPSGGRNERMMLSAKKNNNVAAVLAAGVISAATMMPFADPAVAAPAAGAPSTADGIVLGGKLSDFGRASYSVFNSAKDVSPLVDAFLGLVDKEANAADVAGKAVDGLLAIPDASVSKYAGILKNDIYKGVSKDSCVTLGGSGSALKKFADSAAVKSVDAKKVEALQKKFDPANSSVPKNGGDICLPPTEEASQKLWTAQAELTFSMPKGEAKALVDAIKKGGSSYATRPALFKLVGAAEGVFSKNEDALKMVDAGKAVEPEVIASVNAALK